MREEEKIPQARSLRKTMTEAEKSLWFHLRDRRLLGTKFRRQYARGPYIADFACVELKIVIELDGSQHMTQESYDKRRDAFMKQQGFTILRFWNNDVLSKTDNVVEAIVNEINATFADEASPHPRPSPVNGRGEKCAAYG
jgi:very-short-patch-repair endonuclease